MKWTRDKRSDHLEDRRAQGSGGLRSAAGLAPLLMFLFRKFGIVGVLVGGAAIYFLGGLSGGGTEGAALTGDHTQPSGPASVQEEERVDFVSFVLDDVQKVFDSSLKARGETYRPANLVVFRGATRSACGFGEAAMGPFYCPADQKAYLDLGFFDELHQRFGAPGDFAQAYVIAHELGHHLQNLLGASERVHSASKAEQSGPDGLSVRLELQADCYAGVWGHATEERKLLEAGDIDEALRAASMIGDDTLQRKATGAVRPESFTHGSAAQRSRWFKRGFETGDLARCDTFSAPQL